VNWLAILLSLAALGGSPVPHAVKPKAHCAAHAKHCKKKPKTPAKKVTPRATPAPSAPSAPTPQGSAPAATPSPRPTPVATATPSPIPTPTPTYPKRTGVDLVEWDVRSSYQTLAAGKVTFNVTDLGEDAHNLSVRGGGKEYGGIDLESGTSDTLTLTLAPGSYTLYCNIPTHEALGMSAIITVR
jgi:Copper binding proteins, plastocyanin/azurin family